MLTVNARPLDEQATDELGPLLQTGARPSRQGALRPLSLLLLICVLERCTFYEYAADVLNSQPSWNSTDMYCGILGDNSSVNLSTSWRSQILLGLAYVLPLLGGFAADWHCGCQRVLQTGCTVYCLGAWLTVCLVYLPSVCSNVFKYLCQAALALGAGLIRPGLMVLAYELGEPLLGTVGLCHLYYACEAAGQVLGCSLAYKSDMLDKPLTVWCVPTTHAMTGLAICTVACERSGWDPSLFQLPTWPRTRRILIVTWPIILMASILMLAAFTFSGWELTHLADESTQKALITNSDLLLLIWSVALFVAVAALALLTRHVSALRPQTVRIAIGMMVLAANQFVSCGLNFGLKKSRMEKQALQFAYGTQSILGAVAEALTFIATNEIAFEIAPVEIRTFILGLFMSLRGSGFFTSILILMGYLHASDNEIFNDTGVAILHLSLGISLVAALLLFLRTTPRALQWLVDVERSSRRAAET